MERSSFLSELSQVHNKHVGMCETHLQSRSEYHWARFSGLSEKPKVGPKSLSKAKFQIWVSNFDIRGNFSFHMFFASDSVLIAIKSSNFLSRHSKRPKQHVKMCERHFENYLLSHSIRFSVLREKPKRGSPKSLSRVFSKYCFSLGFNSGPRARK